MNLRDIETTMTAFKFTRATMVIFVVVFQVTEASTIALGVQISVLDLVIAVRLTLVAHLVVVEISAGKLHNFISFKGNSSRDHGGSVQVRYGGREILVISTTKMLTLLPTSTMPTILKLSEISVSIPLTSAADF